jgi:hypothetical protein
MKTSTLSLFTNAITVAGAFLGGLYAANSNGCFNY